MLLSLRRTVFASVLLGSLIFVQVCCADDIRKMVDNGDDAQKFVWVILSEGYRAQEADTFREDAQDLIDAFLAATPFKEYQSAINIYTLFRASDQSGADHPSQGVYIETAFHATFDSYGMARLLTVDSSAAFNAAMQIPHFDVVFAVVNDDQYGGSGGSVIAVSTHASSNEIALHEAGHVIGKLADEYETPYPGYPSGDPEPNVTYQSQKKNIPWSAWIDDLTQVPTPDLTLNTVGLFEGARYIADGIYRPTFTSKMRSLNQPFYEVNTEALILRIYDYVNPIQETGPQETLVALSPGAASKFWVDTIAVDTFDILWEVDGQVLENEAGATFAMLPSAVKQGRHTVSVWVSDVTDLVRADTEDVLTARQTWEVEKAFCSGQLKVSAFDAQTGEVLAAEAEALTSDITQAAADGSIVFDDLACGSQQLIVEAEGYVPAEQEVSIADGKTAGLTVRLERLDLPEPVGEALYISGTISGDVKAGVGIALVEDAGMTVIAGA
ncbi:MAG: hypothetical protein GY868_11735, partial [Deltaproteobacteria bacterium]|nr:hypothetical protein [Deltaproteobacteria bacterium]